MLTSLTSAHYVAILLGAVASFIIGWLWYSPYLFGNIWAKEHGSNQEKMKEGEAPVNALVVSFLTYLVTGYVMTLVFKYLPVTDIASALSWGFLLWLGFPAAVGLMHSMFSAKSLTQIAISAAFELVYIEAIAIIITFMR